MMVYVISELQFEYNDEINFCRYEESGKPIKAYRNKENAIKRFVELCLEFYEAHYKDNFSEYCYGLADVCNLKGLKKYINLDLSNKDQLEDIQWVEIFRLIKLESIENQYIIINTCFSLKPVHIQEIELYE